MAKNLNQKFHILGFGSFRKFRAILSQLSFLVENFINCRTFTRMPQGAAAEPAGRRQQDEPRQEPVQRDRPAAGRPTQRLYLSAALRRQASDQRHWSTGLPASPAAAAETSAFTAQCLKAGIPRHRHRHRHWGCAYRVIL